MRSAHLLITTALVAMLLGICGKEAGSQGNNARQRYDSLGNVAFCGKEVGAQGENTQLLRGVGYLGFRSQGSRYHTIALR